VRIVMMGTPAFAVPTLDALLGAHDVAAVYCRPDRASGRGRKVVASPMKEQALAAGVPVEQPATLRDPEAVATLSSYAPDVIVVAAYGLILPPEVLAVPQHGCLNVHGSLLPRWRGAAPVQRAILAGDEVTGVSIMQMEEGLDTGPWCLQVSVPVDEKSADEPAVELARLLVQLSPEPLDKVFLCDSGSVSVEVALKMALQYWQASEQAGKHRVITVRGGYHGDTFHAMSVCDPSLEGHASRVGAHAAARQRLFRGGHLEGADLSGQIGRRGVGSPSRPFRVAIPS